MKNIQTARETWRALREIHERHKLSSKLYLLRKLYSIKLAEGGNVIKNITKIMEIVDKLAAIGEVIRDNHISALLLCSLPISYDTLITAFEASKEVELSPSFIQSKLIDEYNRRYDKAESSENTARAFKTQKIFNYRKENKYFSSVG